MADKTATWSLGESVLWYDPTSGIDAHWSLGESALLDVYVPSGGEDPPDPPETTETPAAMMMGL
jgi:hypothetical protein